MGLPTLKNSRNITPASKSIAANDMAIIGTKLPGCLPIAVNPCMSPFRIPIIRLRRFFPMNLGITHSAALIKRSCQKIARITKVAKPKNSPAPRTRTIESDPPNRTPLRTPIAPIERTASISSDRSTATVGSEADIGTACRCLRNKLRAISPERTGTMKLMRLDARLISQISKRGAAAMGRRIICHRRALIPELIKATPAAMTTNPHWADRRDAATASRSTIHSQAAKRTTPSSVCPAISHLLCRNANASSFVSALHLPKAFQPTRHRHDLNLIAKSEEDHLH